MLFDSAKASKRLGLKAHVTFSGALAWPYFYPWPQRPAGLVDTAFEELARRARSTIWLTPEPRFSWGLGGCDLPAYAEFCERVQVVRNLRGLDRVATSLTAPR